MIYDYWMIKDWFRFNCLSRYWDFYNWYMIIWGWMVGEVKINGWGKLIINVKWMFLQMDSNLSKELASYCSLNNKRLFIMYGQTEASPRISYPPPRLFSGVLFSIISRHICLQISIMWLLKIPSEPHMTFHCVVYYGSFCSLFVLHLCFLLFGGVFIVCSVSTC